MKKWILATVCLALSALPVRAQECDLRVGYEEWAPYVTVAEDGTLGGIEIDMMNAIAAETGCALTMVELPWARALVQIETAKIDVLFGASYTVERSEYAQFSIPYRNETIMLATRTDLPTDDDGRVSLQDWVSAPVALERPRILGVVRK